MFSTIFIWLGGNFGHQKIMEKESLKIGVPIDSPTLSDPFGPLCVVLLISWLSGPFGEAWEKMNASEKRIRQLEEKIEKLLGANCERESTSVQGGNAPDDRFFSPH